MPRYQRNEDWALCTTEGVSRYIEVLVLGLETCEAYILKQDGCLVRQVSSICALVPKAIAE
jgi:hypothetical protein